MVKRANAHASELVNPASEQTRAGQVAATRKVKHASKKANIKIYRHELAGARVEVNQISRPR